MDVISEIFYRLSQVTMSEVLTDPPGLILSTSTDYMLVNYSNFLNIFTDGSKGENGCGCSFYILDPQVSVKFSLNNSCSIFSAELFAIFKCLKWVSENPFPYIGIFSDSLSAIQALDSSTSSDKLVIDIINLCSDLSEMGVSIAFVWIPAHRGIPGNEEADILAKETAGEGPSHAQIPPTIKESRALVRAYIQEKWEREFVNFTSAARYKLFWPSTHSVLSFEEFSRREWAYLFRLQTGHCRLNLHLFRIGCHPNGLCEYCLVPESVDHFISHCPRFTLQRRFLTECAARFGIWEAEGEDFHSQYHSYVNVNTLRNNMPFHPEGQSMQEMRSSVGRKWIPTREHVLKFSCLL